MPKEPIFHKRVRVIDIDGTILKKRAPHERHEEPVLLGDAGKIINEWFEQGDYILLWTARPNEYYEKTFLELERCGIRFHELICDKPYSYEIHIYDDNDIYTHKVDRDVGLDVVDKLDAFKVQAAEIRSLRETLEQQKEELSFLRRALHLEETKKKTFTFT